MHVLSCICILIHTEMLFGRIEAGSYNQQESELLLGPHVQMHVGHQRTA